MGLHKANELRHKSLYFSCHSGLDFACPGPWIKTFQDRLLGESLLLGFLP